MVSGCNWLPAQYLGEVQVHLAWHVPILDVSRCRCSLRCSHVAVALPQKGLTATCVAAQRSIRVSFFRMRSKASHFTLGVWGLRVCSLDVAQPFAAVRVRSL